MQAPPDVEEIAAVMRRLRQQKAAAEKAQLDAALALPVPACMQRLVGKSGDELKQICKDIFAKLGAADVAEDEASETVGRADEGLSGEDASLAGDANNADGTVRPDKPTVWVAATPPTENKTEASPTVDCAEQRSAQRSDAAGPSANAANADVTAQRRLPEGRDPSVWKGMPPVHLRGGLCRNVERRLPDRLYRCHVDTMWQMAEKVFEQNGGVCEMCDRVLRMVVDAGGKKRIEGAEYDHIRPLAWVRTCPALAAETNAARMQMARDGGVFQLLCGPCHKRKTERDTALAAKAANATLFSQLFAMDASSQWTVDRLVAEFDAEAMQALLSAKFHADLIKNNESLAMYDIGPGGLPLCECECKELTEVTLFTWSQDKTKAQIHRDTRARMLKPRCRSCHKCATVPLVCRATTEPHFSCNSIADLLRNMRNSKIGWLMPANEAELAEWRRKFALGVLWFG